MDSTSSVGRHPQAILKFMFDECVVLNEPTAGNAIGKNSTPNFTGLTLGLDPFPITSGLTMVPKADVSNYCATKAALHSLSISLFSSLSGTNVHVMEVLPPLAESELHDQQGTTEALSKYWMSLDEFTKYAMEGLQRGDFNIVVPSMKGIWEKLEAERIAMTRKVAFTKD